MIASQQPLLITLILVGAAVLFLSLEYLFHRRTLRDGRMARWRTHLGFVLVNMPIERSVQVVMIVALYGGIQALVESGGGNTGILPILDLPLWGYWLASIVLLDLAVWAQHWATHHIPLLWRMHRVHHSDRDLDMTTALRFHPLEIALSMLYKMGVVFLLGVPLGALIVFELLLSLFPLFNHANVRLPLWLDRLLRLIIVTPDMHRVHHSTAEYETNSNYGFCFSFWDRLFGTYTAQPQQGHDAMTIGLTEWQDDKPRRFGWAMLLPFR